MKLDLYRRGFNLGPAGAPGYHPRPSTSGIEELWSKGYAVFLAELGGPQLETLVSDIEQSNMLYQSVLAGDSCDEILMSEPYSAQLEHSFESLGSSFNEGEPQEIEMISFDAVENSNILAEDLWLKLSWLSFHEEDTSLRFRFSFGEDHLEDVAADPVRQLHAAKLTECIFPESRIITKNPQLTDKITKVLDCSSHSFVERIVYFNAPNGGAYLHHDRERGHAGVIYAQLSGSTYWLTLPRYELVNQIKLFCELAENNAAWPTSISIDMQSELNTYCRNLPTLVTELESFSNTTLIHLMNETELFVQQLISNGFGTQVNAGDMMLLPQESDTDCCWHSVFNLGVEHGQALSFAIRADEEGSN